MEYTIKGDTKMRIKKYEYYYVYLITQIATKKQYVGCHGCNCIPQKNVKYIGSGTALRNRYKQLNVNYKNFNKYFVKQILNVYDNKLYAATRQSNIVNYEFVNRADTYNINKGGSTGPGTDNTLLYNTQILQYDKYGKLLKQWKNINQISQQLNIQFSDITRSLNCISFSSNGYVWTYKNDLLNRKQKKFKVKKVKRTKQQYFAQCKLSGCLKDKGTKPVVQIDKATGKQIKVWVSARRASQQLNIAYQNICATCLHKYNYKSAGGYVWSYYDAK